MMDRCGDESADVEFDKTRSGGNVREFGRESLSGEGSVGAVHKADRLKANEAERDSSTRNSTLEKGRKRRTMHRCPRRWKHRE